MEKSVKLYRRETWSNQFDLSDNFISQVGFVSDTFSRLMGIVNAYFALIQLQLNIVGNGEQLRTAVHVSTFYPSALLHLVNN